MAVDARRVTLEYSLEVDSLILEYILYNATNALIENHERALKSLTRKSVPQKRKWLDSQERGVGDVDNHLQMVDCTC